MRGARGAAGTDLGGRGGEYVSGAVRRGTWDVRRGGTECIMIAMPVVVRAVGRERHIPRPGVGVPVCAPRSRGSAGTAGRRGRAGEGETRTSTGELRTRVCACMPRRPGLSRGGSLCAIMPRTERWGNLRVYVRWRRGKMRRLAWKTPKRTRSDTACHCLRRACVQVGLWRPVSTRKIYW